MHQSTVLNATKNPARENLHPTRKAASAFPAEALHALEYDKLFRKKPGNEIVNELINENRMERREHNRRAEFF